MQVWDNLAWPVRPNLGSFFSLFKLLPRSVVKTSLKEIREAKEAIQDEQNFRAEEIMKYMPS